MSKKAILFGLTAVLCSAAAFGGKAVGAIDFFAGEVSIARNGKVMGADQLAMGDVIEDFDVIRTGPKGTMDLTLYSAQRQEIRLKVQNSTTFSVETGKLNGGKERTTLQMANGSLGLKVAKLSGNQLQVKTKSAAMGVRGTDFIVTTSPTEDVLVTCSEGSVSCVDEQSGVEQVAEPGRVVERDAAQGALTAFAKSAAELDNYRQEWMSLRMERFKKVAARHILGLAKLYERPYKGLQDAYQKLLQKKAILQRWEEDERNGVTPSTAEARKDKLEMFGVLARLKGYLLVFEPLFFQLENYFNQGDAGDDPAVKKFYDKFREQKKEVEEILFSTRYYIKLYASRSGGYFPVDLDAMMDDGLSRARDGFETAKKSVENLFD